MTWDRLPGAIMPLIMLTALVTGAIWYLHANRKG